MWAQEWTGIVDLLLPYPDKPGVDVTEALVTMVGYLNIQLTYPKVQSLTYL